MDYKVKIAALMDDRGVTQYKLSKISSVSQGVISDIVSGKNAPSLSTLEKLCAALGITLSEFFAEDAAPDPAESELLAAFRNLPEEKRAQLLRMMRVL